MARVRSTTQNRARELRRKLTDAERILWAQLRNLKHHGLHFRRQVPIGRYIADFACHSAKLVIELDGAQHGEEKSIRYDAERTEFMASEGYSVLRYWNLEAITNSEGIVEAIVQIAQLPPSRRPESCGE